MSFTGKNFNRVNIRISVLSFEEYFFHAINQILLCFDIMHSRDIKWM